MKKNTIPLLLSLFLFGFVSAQDSIKVISKDSVAPLNAKVSKEKSQRSSVLFSGEHLFGDSYGANAFGLGLNIPVGEHTSLNYRFLAGRSSDRRFYYRGSLGGTAGGWLLARVGDGPGSGLVNLVGVVLLLVPEGITVRTPLMKNLELHNYVNPLCADFYGADNPADEEFYVSGEIGSSLRIPLGPKWFAQPHGGVKYHYKTSRVLPEFGVSIGIYTGN